MMNFHYIRGYGRTIKRREFRLTSSFNVANKALRKYAENFIYGVNFTNEMGNFSKVLVDGKT